MEQPEPPLAEKNAWALIRRDPCTQVGGRSHFHASCCRARRVRRGRSSIGQRCASALLGLAGLVGSVTLARAEQNSAQQEAEREGGARPTDPIVMGSAVTEDAAPKVKPERLSAGQMAEAMAAEMASDIHEALQASDGTNDLPATAYGARSATLSGSLLAREVVDQAERLRAMSEMMESQGVAGPDQDYLHSAAYVRAALACRRLSGHEYLA